MKIIRRQPEPVKTEIATPAKPAPAPVDASAMQAAVQALQAAVQALHAAAERMQSPTVEVRVPEIKLPAQEKPKAFTVTITKRDSKGRAVEFDVRVKDEEPKEEPDAFTTAFNNTTKVQ